jgi:hypothetical protein
LLREETTSRFIVQISRCASLVQQAGEKMAVHKGSPLTILGYPTPTVFNDVPVRQPDRTLSPGALSDNEERPEGHTAAMAIDPILWRLGSERGFDYLILSVRIEAEGEA